MQEDEREHKLPTPDDTAGTCRRCGAYSNFRFDDRDVRLSELYESEIGNERLLLCACQHCQRSSLIVQVFKALPTEEPGIVSAPKWVLTGEWPSANVKVLDYIPEEIEELYREAVTCLGAGCYRATAVMVRGALDAAMKKQKATGRTLYDRIKSMHGQLRQQLIDIADTMRLGGNDAAHVFAEEWEREEASELLAFLGEALRELYQTPQRLARLQQRGANRPKI